VGGAFVVAIVIGSLNTLSRGIYSLEAWLDFIIFGLAQGSLYALIALGYTLVYGILRMINFAHGEVFMSGAFTGYFVAQPLAESGLLASNPIVALAVILAVAVMTSVIVAVLLERIAYRPLRRAPRLVPLITAIGASFFLQYTFAGLYGTGVKRYPDVPILRGDYQIAGIEILKTQAVVIVAAIVLMLGLWMFVMYTKTGKAMRAVSEDKDTAALMGIDVDAIIVRTFVIGAALAGAAGLLYALLNGQVQFFMGFQPGLKAFTAAVLGGIGNVPGAMVGGLFLGLFESLGPSLFLEGLNIPASYQLKDAIAFTMLVMILIFRPSGILGERLTEKKA
jgi:branched-chain amino acid transport system permease protein